MIDLKPFQDYLVINTSSKATAQTVFEKVDLFFKHNAELTQETLNAFLTSKNDIWQNQSFNLFIYSMKWYCKYLKLTLEFPKTKKIHTKVKAYINEKEIDEIINQMPLIFEETYQRNQVIFSLMFTTGIRPKDVIQLKRSDFDFEKKIVTIRNTKTFRDREVVLSDEVCKLLQNFFQTELEQDTAFNITQKRLKEIFTNINKCLDLKKNISPYTIRSSYAHDLIKKGIKLTSLQSSMGHTNSLTTLGYLQVSSEDANNDVREILNKKRRK
jgi:site-specific recombinase XerD